MDITTPHYHPKFGEFSDYLTQFKGSLKNLIAEAPETETHNHLEGLSAYLLRNLHAFSPLSVFIPEEFGGWGDRQKECFAIVEAASYESIAIGLTLGINTALFLDPLKKYADPTVKASVLKRFIDEKAMGGLMITEPDFGTDALSMETCYQQQENGYGIKGTKHWGGLTGLADFWIVTARKKRPDGSLTRDLDMFMCDMNDSKQRIEVAEFYQKLGLYQIPYGRNEIDIVVPENHRFIPQTSGIKMMMDCLHRSRLRLPAIGMGFIRRILDEATQHCSERFVGKKALENYDQVQYRLAEIQAFFTLISGFCHYSHVRTSLEIDLAGEGIEANATKALMSDMMQEGAQSLMQLVGGNGFRRDHIAGRAIVDSRPFQIFEGSNDVMYSQVSEMILKQMIAMKELNIWAFMKNYPGAALAALELKELINLPVTATLSQRKSVQFGKLISWILALNKTIEMSNSGFNPYLVKQTMQTVRERIIFTLSGLHSSESVALENTPFSMSDWKNCSA